MLDRLWPAVCYALAGVVSLAFLALGQAGAEPQFPALTGRVVDDAGVLSDGTKRELTAMLAADERQSGRQVVVVTLKSLQGYDIADYGYRLGRHWGIGQKGKDNGALVIVAPKERKARIEVGYGLEGALTDAQSRVIIERYMRPAFVKGDYDGGVLAGTRAVLQTFGDKALSPPPEEETGTSGDDDGGLGLGWIIFIVILLVLFRGGFWPLFFLGGFGGGRGGWGGGGWSGGGGGGFSGGGGSFGGGGASGSW
ncbi:MAG TPA: TPM domain-containing protein [Rhizomicrobium sp.]|jgi:uncharacterized protein|nr:TPM domain-containing protein [Rhizomicrobium sp.]